MNEILDLLHQTLAPFFLFFCFHNLFECVPMTTNLNGSQNMKISIKIKTLSHPHALNVHHTFNFSNKKLIPPYIYYQVVDYLTLDQYLKHVSKSYGRTPTRSGIVKKGSQLVENSYEHGHGYPTSFVKERGQSCTIC